MPRYEFQEGTSSKFWEITLLGKSFTTKFGKIGSAGQTKLKEHASEGAAKAEYEKLIAEKTKKGYQLVGNGKSKTKPGKATSRPARAKGATQYFEYKDGKSSKFWEITLDGARHTVRFGKIGTAGQTSVKQLASPGEAYDDMTALVREKMKKGYQRVGGEEPTAADTPLAVEHASNDKLEAAIRANPDDADAYLVYADWLQAQGDPRGELIVLSHGKKAAAAKKHLEKYARHFYGKLADALDMLEPYPYGPIGRATAWRWGYLESLWISTKRERSSLYDGSLPSIAVSDALGWMLDHPSCKFLRELTVGIVAYDGNSYDKVAKVIGARELPTLRKLVLGDFYSEETELNWSSLGDVSPIYKAVPNLESLTLRSGTMKLGKVELPRLRELRIITGGLDRKSLAGICAAKWPHLETLSIQLGNEERFRNADLAPILDARAFPKVKHLGLGNAEGADEIAAWLAGSKIAAQLESLDLSQGTLGDAGASALAAGKFPRLARLDVTNSWLGKAGLGMLAKVARKVESGGRRGQQSDGGDPENRYISEKE